MVLTRPHRIAFTKPELGHTFFSGDRAYLIFKLNKNEFEAVDNEGVPIILPAKQKTYNGIGMLKEQISGYSGLWFTARMLRKKIEIGFANIKYTFEPKGETTAIYNGKLYKIVHAEDNKLTISDGEETLVSIKDVRVFINEDDAKKYLKETKLSWIGLEKLASKMEDLMTLGFGRLDKKKIMSLEHGGGYLKSDNPKLFVRFTQGQKDLHVFVGDLGNVPVDAVDIITKKEFDDGVVMEQKMRDKRIIGNRILRTMEEELRKTNDTINTLQASLILRLRERSSFIKKIKAGDLDDAVNTFYDEVKELEGYDNVSSVVMDGGILSIQTKDIFLRRVEGFKFDKKKLPLDLGAFIITIDIVNNVVAISQPSLKPYLDGKHPHVGDGGTICFGNMQSQMISSMAKLDIITVFDTVVRILEEINTGGHRLLGDYIERTKI